MPAPTYTAKRGDGSMTNSGNLVFNLSSNFTAGSFGVALVHLYNSSARVVSGTTLSDNQGNTWTLRTSTTQFPGSNGSSVGIFTSPSMASSGTHTMTMVSTGFAIWRMTVYECSAATYDIAVSQANAAGTSHNSPAQANAVANSLVLAFLCADGNSTTTISTPATGFTLIEEDETLGTASPFSIAYLEISAIASQQASWTTGTSLATGTGLLILSGTGGGGPTSNIVPGMPQRNRRHTGRFL